MNQITFVPVGGLANRMRSIASVITLAQQTKSYVNIFGFKTGLYMLLFINCLNQ